MSFKTALLGAAASGVIAISAPALGQETTSDEAEAAGQGQSEDVIVVTGRRGSILNSIAEKRDADALIDVLSADQAGRFPDPNVAEALARIPGIGFQRENDTGQGEFISIRGLDASYNTVLFDGIRTGTADEYRRTALDIVTANNISSIRVTKAPLPQDATEGIGGVVDIRTRGPLERPETGYVSADIRENTFDDRNGYRFGAGISRRFGDDFGVNLSGAYRQSYFDTLYVNPASNVPEQLNAITLTGRNGATATFTDEDELDLVPKNRLDLNDFTNEQINFEDNLIGRENLNLAAVVDWRIAPHTILTFGARYTRDETTQTTSNVEFDADNGDILPDGMGGFLPSTFPDPEVTFEGQIEDSEEIQERYFLRGETFLDNWTFNYIAGYSRAFEDEPVLSIDFTNDFDSVPGGRDDNAVTFVPLDLTNPPFARPDPKDLDVFLLGIDPFCTDASGDPCGEINDFDETLEDSRENTRYSARFDTTYDFDDRGALQNVRFGLQYEESEYVDRFIDLSDVDDSLGPNGEFLGVDRSGEFGGSLADNNAAVGDYGLVDGSQSSFDRIGSPFDDIGLTGVTLFDPDALRDLRRSFRESFFASGADFEDVNLLTAKERFLTAYVQSELTFGRLDIIGGVRVEQYDADFSAPQDFTSSVIFDISGGVPGGGDSTDLALSPDVQNDTSADNFVALPRVAFNYNVSDRLLLRAAYTTSIARPTFDLLAAEVSGDFDIELIDGVAPANATLADVQSVEIDYDLGNPNLENAYSRNLDFSAEFYFDDENALTVAVFYKEIDDFIYNTFALDGGLNPSLSFDPVQAVQNAPFSADGRALIEQLGGIEALTSIGNAQIDINVPENGDTATVYGVEIGAFHTFSYLPGLLSNLAFAGNLTLQETKTEIEMGVFEANDALVVIGDAQVGDVLVEEFAFFNSPEVTGNAAIFYTDDRFEISLAYRYAGIQLEEVEQFGFSQYQQARGFLDFDFEYTFDDLGPASRVTLFFSANDILDDGTEPTTYETYGRGDITQNFASFNGRSYRAGFRLRF